MNIKQAFERMTEMNYEAKRFLKEIKYEPCDDLSGVEYDNNNPEDMLLRDELRSVCDHLDSIRRTINYLNRGIVKQGVLTRNARKRYEIDGDGYEYTSGDGIEFLYYDDFDEKKKWFISRVESAGGEYYIWNHKSVPMDGLVVRVREAVGPFHY